MNILKVPSPTFWVVCFLALAPRHSIVAQRCVPSCTVEEEATGICGKSDGECAACPVAETCEKLCRRCEGRAQDFGSLDCGDCSAYTPPPVTKAPVAPIAPVAPPGRCIFSCTVDEGSFGVCGKSDRECTACPVAETCEKLCRRCEGRAQDFGSLDCGDCSAYTPPPVTKAPVAPIAPVAPPGRCIFSCTVDEESFGICGKSDGECTACPVAETCEKLCRRCEGRAQEFGGLDCGDCSAYTPPPTQAPVAPIAPVAPGRCIPSCTVDEESFGVCGKSDGECAACPVDETCEKLCRRCEGRAQEFGSLDCGDCSAFTPPPVTKAPVAPIAPVPPPGRCIPSCTADEESFGICGKSDGECTACPLAETCEKLCRRCEGRAQEFGSLDCGDCSAYTPPPTQAPVAPVAPGRCIPSCTVEEGSFGVCGKSDGECAACPVAETCEKLCRRCEGRAQEFGSLDCGDCSTYTPPPAPIAPVAPPGRCIPSCTVEEESFGVCGKSDGECAACDVAETCEKLCRRCEGRAQEFGSLDCGDCSAYR